MDNEIIKFIIDLGSIGAICFVVYIMNKYFSEASIKFTETLTDITQKFAETVEHIANNKKDD